MQLLFGSVKIPLPAGLILALGLFLTSFSAHAATKVVFSKGAFTETILIKDLRNFFDTGDTDGLEVLFGENRTSPEKLKAALGRKIENLRLADASRVFRSKAGFQILLNLGKGIKPFRTASLDVAAKSLRGSIIKSLQGDQSATFLEIFENYSSDTIWLGLDGF